MAVKFIVLASMVAVAFAQQQRPAFARFSQPGRGAVAPVELEPQQAVPQPFRRAPLPLYRGRGFSLDGQEPKPNAQPLPLQPQPLFLVPRPPPPPPQPSAAAVTNDNNNNNNNDDDGGFGRTGGNNNNNEDAVASTAQPTRQAPLQPLQQQSERIQQQQQIDRIQQQQQQVDKIQQQPEKRFPSFRPQPQIQPVVETQPQFVRKVVQRPVKRVQHQPAEETVAPTPRSPEMIQRLKNERSESAVKQRAKKPVSQVLRRYRDDNPDGSITWGFENDDGTFKEETIGTDCVTRGKYGYVDPEGVKREYAYESGVPCDRNRNPLQPSADAAPSSSAVQEAQASDSYGYIDYTKNQYVMANGQTIDLNGMAKNRARKPVPRKNAPAPPQQQQRRDDY